jgi:S1-C subfamily serine protease
LPQGFHPAKRCICSKEFPVFFVKGQDRWLRTGVFMLSLYLAPSGWALANEELYLKVAPSTAVILHPDGGYGTGFLVDGPNRLLVTARHVVAIPGGVLDHVQVVFAQMKDGAVVTDTDYYRDNEQQLEIRGKVIYENVRRDMAVIQLDKAPVGVKPLDLADRAVRTAQEVHVIGNSTRRHGGMFSYCYGKVRNTFRWDPPGDPIVAQVVSHSTPTNQGDSGGPVVNGKGEVVAFISQGTIGLPVPQGHAFHATQVTDHSICVTEIRKGLDEMKPLLAKR